MQKVKYFEIAEVVLVLYVLLIAVIRLVTSSKYFPTKLWLSYFLIIILNV